MLNVELEKIQECKGRRREKEPDYCVNGRKTTAGLWKWTDSGSEEDRRSSSQQSEMGTASWAAKRRDKAAAR